MTTLVLGKGGATELSALRLWQGRKTDLPLTTEGENSAGDFAVKVSQCGIEVIVSSKLLRCFQTAEIVAEKLGVDSENVVNEPLLDQRAIDPFEGLKQEVVDNFYKKATGDFEKRNADELFEDRFVEGIRTMSFEALKETYSSLTHIPESDFDPKVAFEKHTIEEIKEYLISGIETNRQLIERVKQIFAEIVERYPGKTIYIVTHTDLIRTAIRIFRNKPITKDWKVKDHAFAVIEVDSEGKYTVLRKVDFEKRK